MASLRRTLLRRRPRGHALARLQATERRLRACASFLGGGDGALAAEVLRLWLLQRERFCGPALARLALRHRDRLFALHRPGRIRRAREALALGWGLRLKRLLRPHAYAEVP